jgi:hypothetical protein
VTKACLSRLCISACLLIGQSLMVSCGGDGPGNTEYVLTGTLRMPLQTNVGGHIYRLQASIAIYGPSYNYLNTSNDLNETALTAKLQPGNYTAYLNEWNLERSDEQGNFQPVDAILVSESYVSFYIYNQSSTTISFQFETDGVVVVIGDGQLNVKFGVTETPPACTVFGSDCPSGTWCPPSGLTGEGLACVVAGSVPIGASCASPSDCVANASCFDVGAGAACASLCPVSDIGAPCAAGGQCTQAGFGYGVCVPSGATLPGTGGIAGSAAVGGIGGTGGKTYGAGGGSYGGQYVTTLEYPSTAAGGETL